jgi:hypothetical protein
MGSIQTEPHKESRAKYLATGIVAGLSVLTIFRHLDSSLPNQTTKPSPGPRPIPDLKRTPELPPRSVTSPIEPVVSEQPKVESPRESTPKRGKNIELIAIWVGIVLLVINIASTWISFKTADAAKDSANEATRLTRQLLRGTDAAHIVTKVVSQDIRRDNRQIRISFSNDGKVNALNVQGSATVCLVSFPAEQKIACKTLPVSRSQLGFQGDDLALSFDGIVGDGDITLMENNQATIQYSSKFRFNDGFDDWVDGSQCQVYVVRHFLNSERVQERNWAPCDAGRTALLSEVKLRAQL